MTAYQGINTTQAVSEVNVVNCVPAAEAGFIVTDSCLTVFLEDQSINANDVSWNYGDDSIGQEGMHTYELAGDYSILQIVSNEVFSDTAVQLVSVMECIVDGISIIPNQDLVIYPNPTKGNIHVEWDKDFYAEDFLIYSVYGSPVFSKKLEQNMGHVLLDTRGLVSGIYHIVLSNTENQQLFGIFVLH